MAFRALIAGVLVAARVGEAGAQVIADEQQRVEPPPPPPPPTPVVVVEPVAKPAPPPRTYGPRWQFDLSFAGGAEAFGGTSWSQIGIAFGLARRTRGPFSIGIRAEMITTNRTPDGATEAILGETLRGMAGLEYTAYHRPGMFDPQIVVGGGIGREMTAWDGDLVDRNLAYLSVEARPGFTIPKSAPYQGISKIGFEVGVRLQIAKAHDEAALLRSCSQCEGMQLRDGYDLGILFYYGLGFGR